MAGVARPLTLPRGWPRRIRSAAVHAISLADFALTAALGWAAQSLNPRLCLRAELERLRQEIELLREEIRIKDARMQRIEAQKRPHYLPTERLAILELRAARNWSLAQLTQIDSDKDLRRRHRVLMVRVDCALRQVVPVARSHLS